MKRTLAFLCALALMLSLVPGAAFAATQDLQAEIDAGAETIVLEADASGITVTRDTTIDLNGYDLSDVTVLGGTLYLQDSQTADYTVADGVYGQVTNVTGNVKAAEGYLQVGNSFHAVNLDIYAMTLRAADVGVYYKSNFAADEIVAAEVESFGVALSVVTAPNASNLETYCGYSQFTGFEAGEGANSVGTSTLLKGIMKAANGDSKNAKNAAMPVYGRAYIKTAEGYFFGETVKRSLQEQVEAIDKVWNKLTDAQKTPVLAMLEGYTTVMESWNIPNIRGIQVPGAGADIEIPIEVTAENGVVTEAVTVEANGVCVTVPAGTKLAENATGLTVLVTEKETSDAGLTLEESEVLMPMDVHVDGLAADNAAPLTIYLGKVMAENLNMGNYAVYHVENGKANEMVLIPVDAEFTAHNQYKYSLDGELTLYMATFSEVAVVSEEPKWEGEFDYSWYDDVIEKNPNATYFEIRNADQLAALSAIVGGMKKVTGRVDGKYTYSEEIIQDSFSGKTIKLLANIDLGDSEKENDPNKIFYPIGYWNNEGTYERKPLEEREKVSSGLYTFNGTFDGNGHTISNFYHNTWEMKGDHNWYSAVTEQYYRDGMGLFGRVYGGTIKNLTVRNFKSDGEIATTGVIAAYADGATFENIAIFDCNPRVYNIGNGGIVGCVGWYAKEANLVTTFENITVDNSNKISALWGSYDVACGGIVGQYYPTSGQESYGTPKNGGITLTNCHVSAQMDVFNDVCGNYMYYAYRYAGMLIGSVRENVTGDDGRVYPKMDGITAEGCTVHYGEWNHYYYCEFVSNGHPSYAQADEYKFSRVPEDELVRDENGKVTGCTHNHTDVEDNRAVYLPFYDQLVTGYGWGVTSKGIKDIEGVTVLDREIGNSYVKFESLVNGATYTNDKAVTIGELFKAAVIADKKLPIKGDKVQVTVSPADENSTAGGTYTKAAADANGNVDWKQGTLTFTGTGAAKITITDYYFCTPTTIDVTINDKQPGEKFDVVMNNGDFLHRVGNNGTVALDKLFKAKDGVTVGTIGVTVEPISGNNVSGDYNNKDNNIQFNNTGVVKVTIQDDDPYCTPTELILEVVDAKNVTSAVSTTHKVNDTTTYEGNIVLLNDCSSGFTVSGDYTFYGNGFTLTYTEDGRYLNNGLKQGIVTVSENGTLDNLHIKASIYPTAFMYYGPTLLGDYVQQNSNPREVDGDRTRYYYQLSAVAASDNAIISNCYIYGGRNNIFINTGNVTVKDTVLECAPVANAQIQSTDEYTVTFENVTTIQHQVNPTIGDTNKVMLGAGILVGPDTTTNPTIVLNGTFKQYNWVSEDDANAVSNDLAKAIINGAVNATAYNHTVNGKKSSNLGIIYMNQSDATVTNETGLPYKCSEISMTYQNNTVEGQVCSVQNATATQIYSDYANADRTTVNGDYIPTFDFDLGDQAISYDGNEDTRYLYGDKNGITALYQDGDDALTLDLSKIATIYKYTEKKYSYTAVCKDSSGNILSATNNVVALRVQGDYTLAFTVDDNIFYDQNGETVEKSVERVFVVPLNLTMKEASIKNAVVNITKTALDGVYNTVNLTDYELRIKFLDCISVTDYDNKGSGTTVNLSSNIASATLTPSGVNVFTTASTITITYTDGRVLTVNLSKISGSSPGTKTAKVNTSGSVYFTTEGALNNKPTEASSQNKCTITSVSFKGNSGSTVTNDTDVTITWALGSSSSCVTADTLVTLADGTQKEIQHLTYDDQLLVWDFYNAEFTSAPISIIYKHEEMVQPVLKLKFDDGTVVKVIESHGFFDTEVNNFVYINKGNAEDYIGHEFVKADSDSYSTVVLESYEVVEELTTAYWVQTAVHNNAVTGDMLSLTTPDYEGFFDYFKIGEDMKYDEEHMQKEIEKYGLFTYEAFEEYGTYDQFIAFNCAYFKILIGRGVLTFEDIIDLFSGYVS